MDLKNIKFPLLTTPMGKWMVILLGLVFIGSIGLDQVSKRHAHDTLLQYEDPDNIKKYRSTFVEVVTIGDPSGDGGFFRLRFRYARNTGAAFSMGDRWPDAFRIPFFYGVTLLAVIFISFYLKTLPLNYHLTRIGLVFMLSGAIGNFLDRLTMGYVIDFLDTDWLLFGWRHDFAVFNIADVAINLGVICFLIEAVIPKKPLEVDFWGNLLGRKDKPNPAES